MTSPLYNQLRNLIYATIVPPNIQNYLYDGYIINLSFQTLTTTLVVDMSQTNTLILTAPFNGNMAPADGSGIQDSFKGTVTVSVNLDDIWIAPCPSSITFDSAEATWNNCLNLQGGAVSAPIVTLTTGSTDSAAILTSLFQSSINEYIASSPHSLGTIIAPNLDQYFAPTYQRFITLNDTGNTNDPRVVLLAMVNNAAQPTGDPNSAFEESSVLMVPSGSNSVFAFDDYTLYEFVAQQLQSGDGSNLFTSVTVSQNPAVLTGTISKKSYSGRLTSQIMDNAIVDNIYMTNAFKISLGYMATVKIIDNSDGTQTIEFSNALTASSVQVNWSNAVVISMQAIYASLLLVSPLRGIIFLTIMTTIPIIVTSLVGKGAKKLNFEKEKDITQPAQGNTSLTLQDILLNEGVVVYANVSISSTSTSIGAGFTGIDIIEAPLATPKSLEDALAMASEGMDKLHATLVEGPKK